jgi:hypothetical protein
MSTNVKHIKLIQHSVEDLQRAIAGKSELYEAAQRNGYYLLKIKASIITEQYITDMVNGRMLCPRLEEMHRL